MKIPTPTSGKPPGSFLSAAFFIGFLFSHGTAVCAVLPSLPNWYEDANTTVQSYTFTTDSLTPSPEVMTNPYGDPSALIEYVPSVGVGTGYQDPNAQFSLNRDGGAWDLGPSGSMLFELPIAEPLSGGQSYIVDVFVNVVYESNLYFPPSLITTPNATISSSDNPNFDQIGIVSWGLISYQTSISAVLGDTISLLLDPPGEQGVEGQENSGSLVDQVDIHTRYTVVPEHRSYSVVLSVSMLLLVCFRLRRKTWR